MQQPTLPRNPTLYLLSLGCPKNRVDSEVMLGTLLGQGYELVDKAEDAEVVLINSCAFIGEAKQESIDAILEHARLKETARCKALVVAGCLTQRYADVLQQEMPEVDYFVGTSAYPRIAEILRGERARDAAQPGPLSRHAAPAHQRSGAAPHEARSRRRLLAQARPEASRAGTRSRLPHQLHRRFSRRDRRAVRRAVRIRGRDAIRARRRLPVLARGRNALLRSRRAASRTGEGAAPEEGPRDPAKDQQGLPNCPGREDARRPRRRSVRRDLVASGRALDGTGAGDRRQGLRQPRNGAARREGEGRDRAAGRLRPRRRGPPDGTGP